MFYTMQALNYKWNGKFAASTNSGKFYDSASVFRCRNAAELNDLLTQMQGWDSDRVSQTSGSDKLYTKISLRDDVLAKNPRRFNGFNNPPTDSTDPGIRADDTATPRSMPLQTVPTQQYFHKLLAAKYKEAGSGNLVIPFSTVFSNQTPDQVDGEFFRGVTYDSSGTCFSAGFWREKILYVKVNIIATDAPSQPKNLNGNLTYGGATYFHTHVPPRSDRTVAGISSGDAPGELLVAPFRYWVSSDFSTTNFLGKSQQTVPIGVAYSQGSAFDNNLVVPDKLPSSFQINDFTGRSIAASGWSFEIDRNNDGGFPVDASHINDIEFIVVYTHSTRVCP
jgi:hypothetical protein